MAFTRIWIAERDPKTGELMSCEPPNNIAVRLLLLRCSSSQPSGRDWHALIRSATVFKSSNNLFLRRRGC